MGLISAISKNLTRERKLRTYVKIEAKDVDKTVQQLAKLAVDLPEVCVWDKNMLRDGWIPRAGEDVPHPIGGGTIYKDAPDMVEMGSYFGMGQDDFAKDCDRIISKTGTNLEGADIYFEWTKKPTKEQLSKLEQRIADVVKPTNMKYRITNKD